MSVHFILDPWFWFQPIFYSVHGWLATEMALWMLFRPYEPKYIPFTKLILPFTPGIFPRGRKKLSISIANTITDLLLTEKDIRQQAERLVTEENIYRVIASLAGSISRELQDVQHLRRLYRYLEQLIPPLSARLVERLLQSLQQGDDSVLIAMLSQFVARIIPKLQFNKSQAQKVTTVVFEQLLPPDTLREGLVKLLNEENAYRIQLVVRKRLKGWQGILIQFFDLQAAILKFRDFLKDDPPLANAFVTDLMVDLHIQDKVADVLVSIPFHTLDPAQSPLVELLKDALVQHKDALSQALTALSEEATHAMATQLLRMEIPWERWLPTLKWDVARFTYTYLNKELEHMVSKALPEISLNAVIVEKIDQFSAKELEQTIHRICKRELRWLAYLGAFLGFWLGLLSNLMTQYVHPS